MVLEAYLSSRDLIVGSSFFIFLDTTVKPQYDTK
ncbi:palindromic element RPE4 domain-containing protein [Rickettsia japonica]|uniref:Palindromic element RPE4 domain-containing protein n=1 Tax=Rickettsia japonica TaxID=35790 RepID=A0ABM6YF23_RICJA|nr:palindromic element RPE4 domain-containing protein [Rickettsia japonica]QHE24775.1 palindromic element RPE4 domain-containing protein [Rickettsia japonica]